MTDDFRGSMREVLANDAAAWIIGLFALAVMLAVIASNMADELP